jgi:thioredoxin-related protein
MKKLFCLVLFFSVMVYSHANGRICRKNIPSSIRGEELLFSQIKQKAKTENKYILLDCYATWCKPCKMMEKEVLSNDTVRAVLNNHFIVARVQVDTSNQDNEFIKKWYVDARSIKNRYAVTAYPTFIFLSPNGDLVHKGLGYYGVNDFIKLLQDAINPQRQYYTLVERYKNGSRDFQSMRYTAEMASVFNDVGLARIIAMDYIDDCLLNLRRNDLYTKDNIEFIKQFTLKSSDKAFRFLYNNTHKIDKVMGNPDYVQSWIHYIITKEELDPLLLKDSKSSNLSPDWQQLKFVISKKYNSYYADRTILDAKQRWYGFKQNWPLALNNVVELITKYGAKMDTWSLNGHASTVFVFSEDNKQLKAAASWMRKVVANEKDSTNLLPAALDTYANLLYRLGKKKEAIRQEEAALEISRRNNISNYIQEFESVLAIMRKGEPNWPVQN